MSGFLLDTDVVSMLSPSRAQASPGFLGWLDRADGEGLVFLSIVTVHEIEKGVALLDRKGATAKAAGLKVWLAGLLAPVMARGSSAWTVRRRPYPAASRRRRPWRDTRRAWPMR